MGLDVTFDCWNGAYSSFNRFRRTLAKQIGVDLNTYEGFGGSNKFSSLNHGITPLLDHSDCDGELTVAEARKIAKALDSILENYDETISCDDNFKEKILQFRDGCLEAIKAKKKIKFQ